MVFDEQLLDELKLIAAQTDIPTTTITARLTRTIVTHLQAKGWHVTTEYPIDLYRRGTRKTGVGYQYHGKIDIFADSPRQALAIEIDRSNKRWSLQKLIHCHDHMMCRSIWIRWRGRVIAPRRDGVEIIDISPHGH